MTTFKFRLGEVVRFKSRTNEANCGLAHLTGKLAVISQVIDYGKPVYCIEGYDGVWAEDCFEKLAQEHLTDCSYTVSQVTETNGDISAPVSFPSPLQGFKESKDPQAQDKKWYNVSFYVQTDCTDLAGLHKKLSEAITTTSNNYLIEGFKVRETW